MTIEGGRLRGLTYDLPVASAQVKTAVLLAGLQAEGRTTVREPGPSRDHTERMLPAFGVAVERDGLAATVRGGARLRGTEVDVPGDASSAAFLVVAALVLPDSEVRLDGVLLSPTRTAFLDVLRAMGGRVEARLEATDPEPVGSIVASSSRLHGTAVDPALVPSLIDEVPALAAAAAFAEGTFTVTGAAELRVKESDRIAALAEGLAALGARGAGAARRPRRRRRGARCAGRACAPTATTASRWRSPWPRSRPRARPRSRAPSAWRCRSPSSTRSSRGPVPERPRRVVLVGFMGSGKTTVGRLLARRLGYGFEDMDRRIEERAGRTIAEIFRDDGEEAFRGDGARGGASPSRRLRDRVVATGGGAFAPARDAGAAARRGRSRCGCGAISTASSPGSRPTAPAPSPGTVT